MASEAEILAPVCETRREQGGNLVDQATNIILNKIPDEEKIEADAYSEVNNNSPDVSQTTEKVALPDEILEVTDLPSGETGESVTPSVSEGDDLNVQVKTIDNETGVNKTTDENIPCVHTTDVSKGEHDQNEMASQQEGLGNERDLADNLDTAAEEGSQENSTMTEAITHATSNSDELQSKNDLNASFCKGEEDISVKKDERPVMTPEDCEILSENTLNESPGDVEYQSKTLEDADADHSITNPTEKSEESSFVQVDRSQMERDEQLEDESEKVPLAEVSTEATKDGKPSAIQKVKDEDEDEDLRNAELLENEPVQIENPAESLHVAPEKIEASNLGQGNESVSSPEQQDTNANLHENTGGDSEAKPVDTVEIRKEIPETSSKIVSSSTEEGSTSAVLQEVTGDSPGEKLTDEVDREKEVLEHFSPNVSNEDVEGNSTIKLDCLENESEVHLAKDFVNEVQTEDGEPKKSEFCENEKSTESILLKIESKLEKTEDSSNISSEDVRENNLGQEMETTSSAKELSVTTLPQEILDEKTVGETVDAAETKEETLENAATIVPDEKPEENPLIQVDSPKVENDEHLENDEEVRIKDENPSRAGLLEHEKDIESASLKEEVQTEKTAESLHASMQDTKTSDLDEETETTGFLEEKSVTENPQGSLSNKAEENTIEAPNTNEKTQENVSNENNDKDSLIQVDASEMVRDTYLEEQMEGQSSTETSKKDDNDDESTILLQRKIGSECPSKVELFDSEKNIDSTLLMKETLEDAPEDYKASASSEDIRTTSSLEGQNLAANPQAIMSDQTINAATTENVATEIPHEPTEESSATQVDCSQIEEEHLEKDTEVSSVTEAPVEEAGGNESTSIHEPENRGKDSDSMEAELENDVNEESTSVKEETQDENPIDSLQADSTIKEQIPAADTQEISSDKIERESIDVDVADTNGESLEDLGTDIPKGENEEDSLIEEDGSQKPSLKEASVGNNNDEGSTVMHEGKVVGENEKNIECISEKEEVSIESLQGEGQEVKASAIGQERETSLLEEQGLTTSPQGIMADNKEDDADIATCVEEGTPEDDVRIMIGISSVTEAAVEETNDNESTNIHESENMGKDLDSIEAELENEVNTESTSLKEDAFDSLQAAHEDIKASDSSIKEQILTADPQEISSDKIEEESIDVDLADMNGESLEDLGTSIPKGDNEDNSPIEEDGSHKPSLKEASVGNNNGEGSTVMHKGKLVGENEKNTECSLVKEEVSIESLPLEGQEVEVSAIGQERETNLQEEQSLTTSPQGIMTDNKEDDTNNVTCVEEETPEDEVRIMTGISSVTEAPVEKTNGNESVSVHEPGNRRKDTDSVEAEFENEVKTESSSVKEEAEVEKPIDSMQAAHEDTKTSDSCQDRNISVTEQIPTADPQEISSDKIERESIDVADTNGESLEDLGTNIPNGDNEDNSPIEEDGSHKPSLKEASVGDSNDEGSTVMHEAEFEGENEKNTECTLVKEELSIQSLQVEGQEVKASAIGQVREASFLQEQSLTTIPQGIMADNKEGDANIATCVKEETPEDEVRIMTGISSVTEAPVEETSADESISIHESENRGKDSDSIEAELENEVNTESTSVKEEAEVEKPIDSLQAAHEDTNASDSGQDKNVSINEQIPTADPQEISTDKIEKESIDVADMNEESLEDLGTNSPNGDSEDNLPIEEPSLKEASVGNSNDEESTNMHEAKLVGENENNIECTVVKEEVSIASLQVEGQEVKVSAIGQARETSLLEEQSPTTSPQGIMADNKEDNTNNATCVEEETPEDKHNVAKTIPSEGIEENLPVQSSSLTEEAPIGDTKETTLVNEEAQAEKPSDSLQVATEDIRASASCQETSSIEEQILTDDSQEISCDKTEEKTVDAAYTENESFEEVPANIHYGDNQDKITIEADGSEKSSLEEASKGNNNDDESTIIHEAKFADENVVIADLSENEEGVECAFVKEEAAVKSLQVANEDFKATASGESGQDRETSHLEQQGLTTNSQCILGDHIEDKTMDETDLNEVTPEDKNVATIVPHEDTEEIPLIQVDCSQMEQKEHLEKESDKILKEEGRLDIDCVKASVSSQDTETRTIEAQVVTTSPQEISCYSTEGNTIDASSKKEETLKDIATHIPDGDNEVSIGKADHEPTITHDKFVDESLVKADLLKNEENTEGALEKEEVYIESFQVASEDIKAPISGQDRETLEKQSLTTSHQGITGDNKEDKIIDAIGVNEEIPEDKNCSTSSHEDTKEDSLIQADCSKLEQNEHSEQDNGSTSVMEVATADTTESTSVKEEAYVEDHIDTLQVAMNDNKEFSPCQDTETYSTKVQILTVDPEDISSDKTIEKTIDATDKMERLDVQDIAKSVPHEDNEENLPTEEDGSQRPALEEGLTGHPDGHESTIMHEAECEDERITKADLLENEKNTEDTLIKEESSIETLQAASEGITVTGETNSQEEKILSATPGKLMGDDKEDKTIDPTDLQEETPKEGEVPMEIENVDVEATTIELKKEEGYLEDLHMTTAVNIAAHEEKDSNSLASCSKDLDFNEDVVGHIAEDTDCKQEESSITEASEQHMIICNENVPHVTSLESEVSELKNDHEVVGEANSCSHSTETEKMRELDDGSITIPANERLAEKDTRESTEADVQFPNGDKETDLTQRNSEAETDKKDIEEELLINDSQYVSESKGLNGEEEKINSNNCEEISSSSKSVALEEVLSSNVALEEDSTSNSFQEFRRETGEEAENEEAQKQEEALHVSGLVQELSMEKIEKDVRLCLASANDYDITQEMEKVEEAPLPAVDENIIETTDRKESEVVEETTENKNIEHVEEEDTTKGFLDDKKPAESKKEETEWGQEPVMSNEKEEIAKPTSIPVANDLIPMSISETPDVDHSTSESELTTKREELHKRKGDNEETTIDKDTDEEDESSQQKMLGVSTAAPDKIEERNEDVAVLMPEAPEENIAGEFKTEANDVYKTIDTTEGTVIKESPSLEGIGVNNRSITDLETKVDDEDPEIIERATATECQEVESTSIEETSSLITKCERDGYEHAFMGSLIGATSDSNEVEFAPVEIKSGNESKIQVLESIGQVQSCDIISETEERKEEEEKLEAEAEIKPDMVVAEDISEQEETIDKKEIMKDNISSEKIKEEDEDLEDHPQDSCKEEVITESHLEDEVKQEEESNTKEIFEVVKNENETEKVPNVSEEADDRATDEPKENILANESIERTLHQEEQAKSIEPITATVEIEEAHRFDIAYVKTGTHDSNKEINSSPVTVPEEEDTQTGANETDYEITKDEALLNQNSNIPEMDAGARELPKGLNENIICEASLANTVNETIEDSEAKKENADTITIQHQEEDSTSKHEILPLPELAQGKESEKQELCSLDEVQAKDEENLMLSAGKSEENKDGMWREQNEAEDRETYVEAEKLDFSSHTRDISEVSISDGAQDTPKDNESSTTRNEPSEEEYPQKSTESQISTVSDGFELIEQASEATGSAGDLKAGIDSGAAVPNATGVEGQQVEEVQDKCKQTFIPVEPPMISTSKIIPECPVRTLPQAEDQQIKLHDLSQESNIRDSEVKMTEIDAPVNLQNVRDISEDVQELKEGSFEVSNKDNPVEADSDKNIETTEGQETEAIQNAPLSETLKQETEEKQLGRTSDCVSKAEVSCEEEEKINDKCSQIESSCSAEKEMVSEFNIHRSSVEDTAQNDKVKESGREIDSPPILSQAKCSDIETAEKDLPVHFAGFDGTNVTEQEFSLLPSKDKHVVLEADPAKNLNSENPNGGKSISAVCSQGEHEIQKPSTLQQEEADCRNEERTDQEIREKPESKQTDKPSLSDLMKESGRETSQMASHSATEKEPTTHREDLHAERTDEAEHEEAKTDEEKDDEEESSEQKGSEALVMVNMGDADVKVSQKKSHNILSGVGSKVKHSIAKVKKAITGKSSHPKPPPPKKVVN